MSRLFWPSFKNANGFVSKARVLPLYFIHLEKFWKLESSLQDCHQLWGAKGKTDKYTCKKPQTKKKTPHTPLPKASAYSACVCLCCLKFLDLVILSSKELSDVWSSLSGLFWFNIHRVILTIYLLNSFPYCF